MTVYYMCHVDPSVKYSLSLFRKKVDKILNHPKSWGPKFVYVDNGSMNDNGESGSMNYNGRCKDIVHIMLTRPKIILKICNFRGLSCADSNTNIIYISCYRWFHGSSKSGLSLNRYRTYVILHEMGHILGLPHLPVIKGEKVPVMNQSTLGLKGGLPNEYPLAHEKAMILQKSAHNTTK